MRTNLWSYVRKVISIFPKQLHRFHSTLKRNSTYFSSWHLSFLSKECIYWKIWKSYFSDFLTCLLLFLQSGYGNIRLFLHQPVSHDGSRVLVIFKLYISKRLNTHKQGLWCVSSHALVWWGTLQWCDISFCFFWSSLGFRSVCVLMRIVCVWLVRESRRFLFFIKNGPG